jgi:hypothetical protein
MSHQTAINHALQQYTQKLPQCLLRYVLKTINIVKFILHSPIGLTNWTNQGLPLGYAALI